MKIIFHLDLDSYFASVERSRNPKLKNKPILISSPGKRTIVSAASYDLRKKGIHAAMPLYKAKRIAPEAIVIAPNFALYVNTSMKIFEYIADNFTKEIEVASIDECYIDVTKLINSSNTPLVLAKKIQKGLLKELGLPASIGISNNKFVAKMSTQVNKPFGITLTKSNDFINKFGNWDITKFHGIGESLGNKLRKININTIKDLANYDNLDVLKTILGKNINVYVEKANGIDNSSINKDINDLKSIGNSITFMDKDRGSRQEILEILSLLVSKVSIRARNRSLIGNIVTISIKEKGGLEIKARSKRIKLNKPINKYDDIFKVSINLFDQLWNEEVIKFVGVSLSGLVKKYETTFQSSIYDVNKSISEVEKIINNVNYKYGKKVIWKGNEQVDKNIKKQTQTKYIESDRIIKHYEKK